LSGALRASGLVAQFLRNSPHFRGKSRLQQWFIRRGGTDRVKIFGYDMALDLSDVIQRDIYSGLYEPYETRALKNLLRPGMTFVDVGTNVGYFTWLAARLVGPAGRVLSFEPGAYAFQRVQRVIRENAVENIESFQLALADQAGVATLYVPRESEGNYNPSLSPYLPDMGEVQVKLERLDDMLDNLNVAHVDMLKVDVEGHEIGVFRGADRSLRQGRIDKILCEFNEGYQTKAGASCDELERFLTDAGFVLLRRFHSKWGERVHNRLYGFRRSQSR
jgi:FkbM family methyltransferase